MEMKTTSRGFGRIDFKDAYGAECSLQDSSSIEPHIWLGIDDVKPIEHLGEKNYMGRMHLNQQQVKDLLPYLIYFAETGEYIRDTPRDNSNER